MTCWAAGVQTQVDSNMSLPESVEEAFDTVRRLIFEDFNAAFHLQTGDTWLASCRRLRGQISRCDCTLTSILDDFAKAPTGCT